jgi:hypothetical protein
MKRTTDVMLLDGNSKDILFPVTGALGIDEAVHNQAAAE